MPAAKKYCTFSKARAFSRSLGIKNSRHWRKYVAGKIPDLPILPDEMPQHPEKAYKNKWLGWEDFLGKSFKGRMKYMSYQEAKAFALPLKLSSFEAWRDYGRGKSKSRKLPKFPRNMPLYPNRIYKEEWEDWSVFLGNPKNRKNGLNRPFAESRAFARTLGLSTYEQWKRYCKGEMPHLPKLPNDILWAPHLYYEEWEGWQDWLGKMVVKRNYVSYEKARDAAIKNEIKSMGQWRAFVEKKLPLSNIDLSSFLPKYPEKTYRRQWKGWGEFTGQPEKKPQKRLASYAQARAFARLLKLKGRKQWLTYIKGGLPHLPLLPPGMLKSPSQAYGKEWMGWGDFLGTGNKAKNQMNFWSFERAKTYVSALKIQSVKEWRLYVNGRLPGRGIRPEEIPLDPARTYKEKFKGYNDFFGSGKQKAQKKLFVPIEEAMKFVRMLRIKNRKDWEGYIRGKKKGSMELPLNIPRWPNDIYKKQGTWKSWADFLGVRQESR